MNQVQNYCRKALYLDLFQKLNRNWLSLSISMGYDSACIFVLFNDSNSLLLRFLNSKGLFKRMQHVGPTLSNIVVSNMLGPFEHHVGYCCIMLHDVGSSLILFKLFIQHRPTFDEKLVQRRRFHGDLH